MARGFHAAGTVAGLAGITDDRARATANRTGLAHLKKTATDDHDTVPAALTASLA